MKAVKTEVATETQPDHVNSDSLTIPIEQIKIKKGFNARKDFGDLDLLASQIKAMGQLIALTVLESGKDKYTLIHGERRLRAMQMLTDQGFDLKGVRVDVISPLTPEAEIEITQLLQNDGKPLDIMEQGTVYTRLEKLGLKPSQIAKKTGYSTQHVRNCMRLDAAPEEIKEAVSKGEVSGTAAVEMMKVEKDPIQQVENLKTAQAKPKTKKRGSKKITKKELIGDAKKKSEGKVDGKPDVSKTAIVDRVIELHGMLVITQKAKKFSESDVWDMFQYCLTGEGNAATLTL